MFILSPGDGIISRDGMDIAKPPASCGKEKVRNESKKSEGRKDCKPGQCAAADLRTAGVDATERG